MVMNIAICGGGVAYQELMKKSIQMFLKMKGLSCRNIDPYARPEMFLKAKKAYDILFLSAVAEKDGARLNDTLRELNPYIWIIYVMAQEETEKIVGMLHAGDHLVVPYFKLNLSNALDKALKYLHREERMKVIFKNGTDTLYIRPEEIYYIEYTEKHKIRIVTKETEYEIRYLVRKAYEKTRRYGFGRTHRGIIVNLLYVVRRTGNVVYLTNGHGVSLAQGRVDEFEADMDRLARGEWGEG